MNSKQYTKTVDQDTSNGNIEDMLNSYRASPQPMVHITYRSPNFGKDTSISKGFEKVRERERDVRSSIDEYKTIDRTILRQFGYEDVPVLLRGVESARRYAVSVLTNGAQDTERIVELTRGAIDHLHRTIDAHESVIPNYRKAKEQVTKYRHSLEEHLIGITDTKEDAEQKLETLTYAIEQHEARAPKDGTVREKVEWRRSYDAMEEDKRSLSSLNLRTTQDLNQTASLIESTRYAGQVLDIGLTMNEAAALQARALANHLSIGIDLYETNASVTDLANDVGRQLETASKLTDLLSKSTHSRMNALSSITQNFSLPNGAGANSIANGGVVNGLRAHLAEMQRFGDEELEARMDSYLP